ncbi:bifunctional heptose 7-phosphate kinase/heptose 1-phosphate adenyltransferase [Saccharopolyspora erythraea]|uniref:PfkB family carbohydrate kinase n=1 Tax=Saccharopolyspora erythraea TaxID=1836 RepID=UPI001BAC9A76|nr:PfkB family carbohydrate kinase [Saccharopolyspora erythraea]QUH05831.1 bifunctional heptose 7-phosphate kinase/heptose 1-phosphate adenyltransferase [Saccharopolyspora erythraea]
MRGPLVVVGDALLDIDLEGTSERLCPDAPVPVVDVAARRRRPGGAGMAALIAARQGVEVVLVAGVGTDDHGRELSGLLAEQVRLVDLPFQGATPCKTRVRVAGQSLLRVDSGEGLVLDGALGAHLPPVLNNAGAVLVADYGRGTTRNSSLRRALRGLPSDVPLVWEPHVRGAEPVDRADLVVPNRAEAAHFTGTQHLDSAAEAGRELLRRWGCRAVAVTLGGEGAMLVPPHRGQPFPVPRARSVRPSADVCGAGDSFAVAVALALAEGSERPDAVSAAVDTASRFVADGGASHLATRQEDEVAGAATAGRNAPEAGGGCNALDVAADVRRGGGRLVATGGCFDLLHPGHVRLLQRARELGDALVVCMNSDDSVRRLKGPARPVVGEADRRHLLETLEPVDAVAVFDESSPSALLDELRPDVWVTGGDCDLDSLPEAGVVHRHGGRTVFVPLVEGYSTTRLLSGLTAAV